MPIKLCRRPEQASVDIWPSITADAHINSLTGKHRISITSKR